jgi:excisionase family DNA binding protein
MASTEHISVIQAAARTGLNASTIRKYCAQGKLPAKQVGKVWIIQEADLKYAVPDRRGPKKKSGGDAQTA